MKKCWRKKKGNRIIKKCGTAKACRWAKGSKKTISGRKAGGLFKSC